MIPLWLVVVGFLLCLVLGYRGMRLIRAAHMDALRAQIARDADLDAAIEDRHRAIARQRAQVSEDVLRAIASYDGRETLRRVQ